jgi:hypothetical protein
LASEASKRAAAASNSEGKGDAKPKEKEKEEGPKWLTLTAWELRQVRRTRAGSARKEEGTHGRCDCVPASRGRRVATQRAAGAGGACARATPRTGWSAVVRAGGARARTHLHPAPPACGAAQRTRRCIRGTALGGAARRLACICVYSYMYMYMHVYISHPASGHRPALNRGQNFFFSFSFVFFVVLRRRAAFLDFFVCFLVFLRRRGFAVSGGCGIMTSWNRRTWAARFACAAYARPGDATALAPGVAQPFFRLFRSAFFVRGRKK